MLDIFGLLNKVLTPKTFTFEQLSVSNAAGGTSLTASKYGNAFRAFITVEGDIRFRIDGIAPTSSMGHLAEHGDRIVLESASDIKNFKAISTTSNNVNINISYSA
jgi:hypothetical protein